MSSISVKTLIAITFAATLMGTASPNAKAQFGQPNPIIGDTGQQISGYKYCPFTGRWVIRTDQRQIRESYLDQNRNYVDPGSYERVNEYETDRNGSRWHITGYRWTSNGVPHGNLNRRRITSYNPGIDIDENQNIVYSPGITHDENQSIGYSVGGNKPIANQPINSRLTNPVTNRSAQSIFNNRQTSNSTFRSGGVNALNPTFPNSLPRSGGMRIRSAR